MHNLEMQVPPPHPEGEREKVTPEKSRERLLTKCAEIMLEGPVKGATKMGNSRFYKKLAEVVDEGRYWERKQIIGYLMDAEDWSKDRVLMMLNLLDVRPPQAGKERR